jgi:hypothetical protein
MSGYVPPSLFRMSKAFAGRPDRLAGLLALERLESET